MSFNDILEAAGGFGLYQKCLTFGCLAFSLLVVSFTYWVQVFILLIPPHRCKLSHNDTEWILLRNDSYDQKLNRCNILVENDTRITCDKGLVYDFSVSFPTYSSENDLVCENTWKVYLVHTIYWIGTIFGTILFGIINDKYGRRKAYQGALALTLTGDIASYFCRDRILFLVARFSSAAGEGSIATIAFVLAIEHCIPSKRRLSIFVWSFVYAMSSLSIVWIAFFTFNWRKLLMISWIPSLIAIVMSYFIPESPSWLLTKGRMDEAVYYLQRMGRINGKTLSKDFLVQHLQKISKNEEKDGLSCFQTFTTLAKAPNLRKRILSLAFLWLASCVCYNGNNLEFHYLPFNMYITYSIGALIEIPGNFFVIFTLDKFGRRWTNAGVFIAGGLFGIISANIQTKSLMLAMVIIMRSFYASAYDITFSYSSEVVPTVIRGRAISFIRACGGLGSAIAPFVVNLAQKDPLLPLTCFGFVGILAGILMLSMPETAQQHLPQTIEEGEDYGKDQSFWLCPFISNHSSKENGNSIFGKGMNSIQEEKEVQCVGVKKLTKY